MYIIPILLITNSTNISPDCIGYIRDFLFSFVSLYELYIGTRIYHISLDIQEFYQNIMLLWIYGDNNKIFHHLVGDHSYIYTTHIIYTFV